MNYLNPTRLLGSFWPLSTYVPANQPPVIVYDGYAQVVVPIAPLAPDALLIGENSVFEYETFLLTQKITAIWEKMCIKDYMFTTKVESGSTRTFEWEAVPYPTAGWTFWKQLKVLWNITFGGRTQTEAERRSVAAKYQPYQNLFNANLPESATIVNETVQKNCAFCKQQVIERQRVFEGYHINVLYNYAPISIGEGRLHFLLVPKLHEEKFTDLQFHEFEEAKNLAHKLIEHYQQKGYSTSYLFHKTGKEAGQSVPHWHMHVVLTATKTNAFFGKLMVLKNMVWGSSPMKEAELKQKVAALKLELEDKFH